MLNLAICFRHLIPSICQVYLIVMTDRYVLSRRDTCLLYAPGISNVTGLYIFAPIEMSGHTRSMTTHRTEGVGG